MTYQTTSNLAVQDAIGQCILTAARIVPDGMLVFFSSYSLLERLVQRWQVLMQNPADSERCFCLAQPTFKNSVLGQDNAVLKRQLALCFCNSFTTIGIRFLTTEISMQATSKQ